MTLKIQGTIVSADYDDDIFASWIDKGLITPSSRITSAIEDSSEPIDLYINSYGGDVFAGGEMYISLIKAAMAGRIASVEVGSLAASMAANIVASLKARGVPVTAFSNSQLMFHGCFTTAEGGAQHMEDVAASLRNINEKVVADLNHLGITDCRAWFAEGREKWISAEDLIKMGIVDNLADGFAAAMPEIKQTATRLAAFAASLKSRTEYKMNIDESIKADETPVADPPSADKNEVKTEEANTEADIQEAVTTAEEKEEKPTEETAKTPPPVDIEALADARANERFAALQSAHDKKFDALTKERDAALASLATAQAVATSLQGDIEKLEHDLAEVRDQLAKAESNRESIASAALGHAEPKNDDRPAREVLASLPPHERAAFYEKHRTEIDNH